MSEERLQKILARAGVASRRAAETLIREGRVRVNGRVVTELGTRADPVKDKVEVDGKRVVSEHPVYYVLHKPREVVTTLDDPEGRESIADLVKRIPQRVYPVGRLDYHTSGVLLLTNDGELAQSLLHPRKRVPKTYIAKLRGKVPLAALGVLRNGVVLDDGKRTAPAELFVTREERGNTWLQITITEGKNRQIHRMAEAVGLRVMRLTRVAFAGVTLEGLPPGRYRELSGDELRKLKRDYKNPSRRHQQNLARERLAEARYGFEPGQSPEDRETAPWPGKKRPQLTKRKAAKKKSGKKKASKKAAKPTPRRKKKADGTVAHRKGQARKERKG